MNRFRLTKSATFEASHRLPNHDGKCARLHGHTWKVAAVVDATHMQSTGPKAGMAADYADIGRPLKLLVEQSLDHWHLNDSTGLPDPTSEALAVWIFDRLVGSYSLLEVQLVCVVVEETCTSRCEYWDEGVPASNFAERER